MAELSGLQVFKYLPAAKKLPEGNCKKCGFPTCMAYALKLAKNQTEIGLCPYVDEALKEIFEQSMKKPQKEVLLGHKNKF
jgi:acetyl-CoA decarbonylase/synthase complex subunit gamma